MRMTVIFTAFAAISLLASACLPHLARGLGLDMMLAYLLLAVLSAMIGLLRGRSAGRPER